MSDLINRLRHVAWLAEEGSEVTDLALEAGDAIGRLRAEVERLTADIDEDLWIKKWPIAKENAALRAEVERLTAESEEWDADTERHVARMAGLLHDTANALHGGPLPGGMWSWHDLPNLASAERALADQLAEALQMVRGVLADQYGAYFPDNSGYAVALAAHEAARRGEP